MATATSTPLPATSTAAASSGQGTDDSYAGTGQSADGGTDPQGDTTPGESAAPPATEAAAAAEPGTDDSRLAEPLRAERRKSNQLEKEYPFRGWNEHSRHGSSDYSSSRGKSDQWFVLTSSGIWQQ